MGSGLSREVGELYSLHGAMAYQRAHQLLGRHEDAAEATQEVFVRAMRGWAKYRLDKQ